MKKKIVVYLPGVFDLFHIGHLNAIINAKAYGDTLVVGVQDDASVYKQKKRYPVIECGQRMKILSHIKEVDRVISYQDTFQKSVMEKLKPQVLVVNEDYGRKDPKQKKTLAFAKRKKIKVVRIPYTKGVSSSKLKSRIRFAVQIDYEKCLKFWESRALEAKKGLKAVNLGTTAAQSEKQLKVLFSQLDKNDQKILDLGCGMGRVAIPLSKKVNQVVAVDFSKSILQVLQTQLRKKKIKNVKTYHRRSDAKLPVKYGSFDGVLIFGILIHLNDPEFEKTVRNAKKLLKPGGKLFVRESVGTHGHFEVDKFSEELGCDYKAIYRTPKAIAEKFKKLGFRVVKAKKLYQQRPETGTWFWSFKRK